MMIGLTWCIWSISLALAFLAAVFLGTFAVAWTHLFCASAAVMQSSHVFACTCHAAEDAACVLGLGDPVYVFVSLDCRCVYVNEDNFEPLVSAVFADPVAVEDF